jgi:hypothetical protein
MSELVPEKKPTLMELLDRDPLLLTKDTTEEMVAILRQMRHVWTQENNKARVEGRRRSSAVTKNIPLGNNAEF